MRASDLIAKKRDGQALTEEEIFWLINAYMKDEIPDYQIAAWLMAVFFRNMSAEETAALTLAMAHSGNIVQLSSIDGIKVDKHSTGGVADTTTLILAPLVAAAGIPIAKMSGRGLGFTGGTIDKLDAIPGFRSTLTEEEFLTNLRYHGIAITGQSATIAPADGKLYALRDVTATVESIPLIASSIMSKKIASGADKIVLDVKVGNGAFMKDLDQAIALANSMVHIGHLVGRETVAVISSMDEPLGQAVGNSLEVSEAIDVLNGGGPTALREICLLLGAYMLLLTGKVSNIDSGQALLANLLSNGQALAKFSDFIAAQGGDCRIIVNRALLPQATIRQIIKSPETGYIQSIQAAQIGYCAMLLGAGREKKTDIIDLAAGIVLHCRVGEYIHQGQPLATVYTNRQAKISLVVQLINQAVSISQDQPIPRPLVLGIVDNNGYRIVE